MNKRGQLFILAAVIISVILVTLTTVFNYALSEEKPQNLYDLSSDIKREGFEVIDYALFNSKEQNSTLSRYTNNISDYILNVEPDAEFLFVYGNTTRVKVEDYTNRNIPSTISLQIGSATLIGATTFGTEKDYRILNSSEFIPDSLTKSINITINSNQYPIKINPGQNFIVIMKKTNKNNTYLYLE